DVEALEFLFEYSTDGGLVWQPLGSSPDPSLTVSPTPAGLTDVRAAATRDGLRGAWISESVAGGSLTAPTGFAEVTPGLFSSGTRLHVTADPVAGAASYRFEFRDASAGIIGFLFRAAPEIDLTIDELVAAGVAARDTVIRLAALDTTGAPGAEAELALSAVAPGKPVNFRLSNGGLVRWDEGTPPQTRGWQVWWDDGASTKVVETAAFPIDKHGWPDRLDVAGLDVFGPGVIAGVAFNLDG
ncbi:hypothetical protein, partial [Roseovarius ramblicola]